MTTLQSRVSMRTGNLCLPVRAASGAGWRIQLAPRHRSAWRRTPWHRRQTAAPTQDPAACRLLRTAADRRSNTDSTPDAAANKQIGSSATCYTYAAIRPAAEYLRRRQYLGRICSRRWSRRCPWTDRPARVIRHPHIYMYIRYIRVIFSMFFNDQSQMGHATWWWRQSITSVTLNFNLLKCKLAHRSLPPWTTFTSILVFLRPFVATLKSAATGRTTEREGRTRRIMRTTQRLHYNAQTSLCVLDSLSTVSRSANKR